MDMEFGPLKLQYSNGVLKPRLWTLAQSEWIANLAETAPPGAILELFAGAGHIGLAAAVLSQRTLVQVDASAEACRWARTNAGAAPGSPVVEIRHGQIDEVLAPQESFPLLIADPPYIPSDEVGRWPEDPQLAIDGGADGTEVLQTCLRVIADHLSVGGHAVLQVRGNQQADWVEAHLAATTSTLQAGEVRSFGDDRALMRLSKFV